MNRRRESTRGAAIICIRITANLHLVQLDLSAACLSYFPPASEGEPEPPAEKSYCRNSQFKSARRDGKTSRCDGKSTPPAGSSTSSCHQSLAAAAAPSSHRCSCRRACFVLFFFPPFFCAALNSWEGLSLSLLFSFTIAAAGAKSIIRASKCHIPLPPRARHRSRRLLHEVQVIFNPLFMTPPPATITVKSGTLLCQTVLQQANSPALGKKQAFDSNSCSAQRFSGSRSMLSGKSVSSRRLSSHSHTHTNTHTYTS